MSTTSRDTADRTVTVLVLVVLVGLGAAGVASFLTTSFLAASFLASLTGPEGPLGRLKSPDLTPALRAAAMCLSKAASDVAPRSLLPRTYFLIAWRLWDCQTLGSVVTTREDIPGSHAVLELLCGKRRVSNGLHTAEAPAAATKTRSRAAGQQCAG